MVITAIRILSELYPYSSYLRINSCTLFYRALPKCPWVAKTVTNNIEIKYYTGHKILERQLGACSVLKQV